MPSPTGSLPSTCLVFGILVAATGGGVANALVAAESQVYQDLNGYMVPPSRNEVLTNVTGYWEMSLMPGLYDFTTSYQISNKDYTRKFRDVTVPGQANANLADIYNP